MRRGGEVVSEGDQGSSTATVGDSLAPDRDKRTDIRYWTPGKRGRLSGHHKTSFHAHRHQLLLV